MPQFGQIFVTLPATETTYVVVRVHPKPDVFSKQWASFAEAVEYAAECLVDRHSACYRVVEIPPGEDCDYGGRVCAELRVRYPYKWRTPGAT